MSKRKATDPSEETKRRIERELLHGSRKAMSKALSRFGHFYGVVNLWKAERDAKTAEAEQAQAAGDTKRAARALERAEELARDISAVNLKEDCTAKALRFLPADSRRLLEYLYLDGRKLNEAAEHFGIKNHVLIKMKDKALDEYRAAIYRV